MRFELFEIKCQHQDPSLRDAHPSVCISQVSTRTVSSVITEAITPFRKFSIDTILLSDYNSYSKFTNIIGVFKHLKQLPIGSC